jgi:hypothetical protein
VGAQHDRELNPTEREFVQSSRLEAERDARHQRSQNRRLRTLLLGVGVLLIVAVVAGVLALVKQRTASSEARSASAAARVALARQLGAQAVDQPRLDVGLLLAERR